MSPTISRRSLILGAAGVTAAGATGTSSAVAEAVTPNSRPSAPRESLVFQAGHDGLAAFHVFGLTTTVAGSVLAFAEGRLQQHDASPHHLAMRRSSDGGATWDPIRYVRTSNGVQSFVNPTPLVDRATGRIHLFYAECFKDPGNTGGSPDSSRLLSCRATTRATPGRSRSTSPGCSSPTLMDDACTCPARGTGSASLTGG